MFIIDYSSKKVLMMYREENHKQITELMLHSPVEADTGNTVTAA
jgi:hypothetical protein